MRKNTLARKLILWIIFFSSLITLLLTAVQLYIEYKSDLKWIHHSLDRIETGYIGAITSNVWLDDKEELKIILNGIIELPEIKHIRITVDDEEYLSSGTTSGKETVSKSFTIKHKYNDQFHEIGSLYIEADLELVHKRLFRRFLIILTSNAFKTFLVAIFIYFLTNRIIIDRLNRINRFVESHDINGSARKVAENLIQESDSPDEIDEITKTINDMYLSLANNIQHLAENEERIRLLLDASGEAIYGIDINGLCTFTNAKCLQLLGYENDEELVGKNIHRLIQHSYEDGTVYPEVNSPIYKANKDRTAVQMNSEIFWTKNGTGFPVEYISSPIYKADKFVGSVISFNDISERKEMELAISESERRYRQIVETAEEGIWLVDEQGVTSFVNEKLANMLGYSVAEMLNQKRNAFMDEASVGVINEIIEKRHKKGEYAQYEVRLLKKDGDDVDALISSNPFLDEHGNYSGSLSMVTDITTRKAYEKDRELMQYKLQQAQKMEAIGLLTGGVAHDFNNILASIMGFSELIAEVYDGDNESIKDYLSEIEHAGDRAKHMIRKMMAFSRQKSEKLKLQNIRPLVDEVLTLVRPTIPSTININHDIDEEIPDVMLDSVLIHQLLMNMCINSRDAINIVGTITITAKVEVIPENTYCVSCANKISGRFVALSISDTGEGIRNENLHDIFQPFFTTKEVGKGSGMGLSMVHGITHDHHGHILLESEQGKGTCFTILFPLDIGENENTQDELMVS